MTEQKERLKLEKKYEKYIRTTENINRQLVSFQANKKMPFYGWFPYKEGFSNEMVSMFIRDYPLNGGVVLDPFAGAATTLFTAKELNFNSIGIEILPIGHFVFKSRKSAEVVDPKEFDEEIDKLKKSGFLKLPVGDETNYHHIPITNGAFPEETEYKLNAYRKYVNDKDLNNDIKNLLLFACFCILEKISYTRKDGQYLRWDYRSKRTKAKLNKGKIYTFEEAIFDQLNRMSKDVREYNFLPFAKKKDIDTELITGSCLDLLPSIKSDSIDLVVTSPPYCNRYDYTRTYALELVFLGINKESIKTLRQSLLTCTVENKEKIDYLKDMYSKNKQNKLFDNAEDSFNNNKALKEVLSILQKYKEQKKLNNSGIYRMVKNYFYEHSFVIYELFRILKSGGRIYYVNDNVRYAGEAIPVDLILSEFAKNSGLKINIIYKLKKGKGNSSQQMSAHGKEELRKCVYYWEKI